MTEESGVTDDGMLRAELDALGRGEHITAVSGLAGGCASDAWLVSYSGGGEVVGKTLAGAPGDLFTVEAEGLAALRETGYVVTPEVLAVTGKLLLLERLPVRADTEGAWERFALDLASVHLSTGHDQFGWMKDGYLGRLPQANAWTSSGHEFFAEHRVLRYLGEPLAERALTTADRRAIERFCDRLPEIVPPMPSVLTHGDLWCGNLLSRADGRIAVIDPAVSYTWAEVDLSMLYCGGSRPPESDRFFAVYQELNPSPPGWLERMPLLNMRELLACVAHFGDPGHVAQIRKVLAPFYAAG